MANEFSVFEMFEGGACRVCSQPVRGTANRKRHLRTHDGLLTETRDGWRMEALIVTSVRRTTSAGRQSIVSEKASER